MLISGKAGFNFFNLDALLSDFLLFFRFRLVCGFLRGCGFLFCLNVYIILVVLFVYIDVLVQNFIINYASVFSDGVFD